MCGIAGFQLTSRITLPVQEMSGRADRMIRILHHRGPDGSATWARDRTALAHARLAIIDRTAAASQPMHDAADAVHVVFNGEIYNFRSLRRELEGIGYRFRTEGDTEVIINGYLAWGEEVFTRLAGMFAIGLWDERRQRLVLARDRLGEKPLCYTERQDGFLFASEIKALLTWPGIERIPDREHIHLYLSFGHGVGEGTAFRHIKRLPPAHVMIVEHGRIVSMRRYWSLPDPSEQSPRHRAQLQDELIERLAQSVKGCLISDVPVGAFLSGGVDSSAVVAMMAGPCGHRELDTFSAGFGREGFDETVYAAMVAERYGTRHHAFSFDASLLGDMARLAWHYDEPFADSSALVTHALAREARKHVTVALTGDGADESFLGYDRYFKFGDMMRGDPSRRPRRMPGFYRRSASGAEARLAATDAYGYLMERFGEQQKLRLYDVGLMPWLRDCSYERLLPFFLECDMPEEIAARFDVGMYLPDDLLVKVDIASMAHGLECRAPFLGHELIEFAARIPPGERIWGQEGKALLKSALEPWLPAACMYRPKVGFRVPIRDFLREEARPCFEGLLLSDRFLDRGLVQADFVRAMLQEHNGRRPQHGPRLWALVMLELWFRTWIDTDAGVPLSEANDPFHGFSPAVPVN